MYINNHTGGGKHLSKTSLAYVKKAKAIINQAIDDQKWVKQGDSTWLYIDMVFYMPDRRIRDSHNMIKLLLDVMQPTIYRNDYYVMPRIQSVEYDKEYPRLELCITTQSKKDRIKGIQMSS
jgi:crossover junction endodeoxyribonuclease RusA